MADQQNTINNRIIFTGIDEAGKQIQTLKQQLKEIQDARDRAFQSKDKQSKFKDEIVGFEKLSALEKETYKYLQEAESGLTKQVEQRVKAEESALKAKQDSFRKFLIEQDEFSRQQEQAITKQYNAKIAADKAYSSHLSDTKGAQNAASSKQMYADDLAQSKNFSSQLQQQMNPQTYTSLQQQIRATTLEAQRLYVEMNRAVTAEERLVASKGFTEKKAAVKSLSAELDGYNKAMGIAAQKTDYLGSLGQKLRSHMNWIIAGGIIGASIAMPLEYFKTMEEIEKGMAGMEQVLQKPIQQVETLKKSLSEINNGELKQFADGLSPGDINQQQQINKLTNDFISIASKYGETIQNVIESGKLWGRAYKDVNVVQALVNASSKLAVADSFDMITANKALESSIMQWGFEIKNTNDALTVSNRIIDSWTNIAHNYTVSAQTMSTANERMASSAKLVGVNFDVAQAMVAVIARKTQAEGAEIGNALRSIFASIHSDKAIKAIEELGVEMYKTGEDGTRSFRDVNEVLVDVMLKTQSTKENVEDLFKSMAGGERKLAA